MKLRVVPPELVAQVWPKVAPYLAPVIQYAYGDYELEHIRAYAATGKWMLLVAEDDGGAIRGAFAVEFINRPTKRVAHVIAMGGKGVADKSILSQLKYIAKGFGATHVGAGARPSVARLLQRIGFTETCRALELEIES